MIEKPMSTRGRLPSDMDGDDKPTPLKCPQCRASLGTYERSQVQCISCGWDGRSDL